MKFYSEPINEHGEVPVADEGQLEKIIKQWDQRERGSDKTLSDTNRCYVVSLTAIEGVSEQLAEIMSLVRTQGDDIVGNETVKLLRPNPKTLIGAGRLNEIAARAAEAGANLLVIDAELSPSQLRNIEDATGLAVSDREVIILNVFMKHARTRRAKVQVEIAHLEYLRPRIRGLGLDMDQQASSIVTGRGPGETASAMLARKLDGRLIELKKNLSTIKKTTTLQRHGRSACKQVALVGYTNAGKTSLMNALTDAKLSARNKPFETLDTTTRSLSCHGGDVVISDTVGFIRRLPERLFESFASTLEGIRDASLLVIVVDVSDAEKRLHLETTAMILEKLGATKIPVLYIFNKSDLLQKQPSKKELIRFSQGKPYVCLSSTDPEAVNGVRNVILNTVRSDQIREILYVPYITSDIFSLIYARCRVIDSEAKKHGLVLTIEGESYIVLQIQNRLKKAKEVCCE